MIWNLEEKKELKDGDLCSDTGNEGRGSVILWEGNV